MNKFAATLGLVALGTTALHAVEATALNPMQRSKPWSVSASLRGFYDDNINLTPNKEDSLGYEVVPSVDVGLAGETTSFNLGYQLNALYYENKPQIQTDKWNLTHIFEGMMAHTFSPRVSMSIQDSLAIGNQPDMSTPLPDDTFQNLSGNNIINYGSIDFNIEASDLLGFNVGYNNAYYNYSDDEQIVQFFPVFFLGPPSTAGLLNRIENRANIDSQWKLSPTTFGILGYMYGQYLYTGDGWLDPSLTFVPSSVRNTRSQTFYVGGQHAFAPTVSGLLKVGATYSDYYGNPNGENEWSPYVLASLKYKYRTTTTLDAGFSYSRSAADIATVQDTGVALAYLTVSQNLLEKLVLSGNTRLQYGTYNGGGPGVDDESYMYFQIGLDLAYQFTHNFSTHLGYTFDDYNTDAVGQSDYNRNRVYIGVSAGY